MKAIIGKKVGMAQIFDENGKVIYAQLVPEITEEPDYDAALSALK